MNISKEICLCDIICRKIIKKSLPTDVLKIIRYYLVKLNTKKKDDIQNNSDYDIISKGCKKKNMNKQKHVQTKFRIKNSFRFR